MDDIVSIEKLGKELSQARKRIAELEMSLHGEKNVEEALRKSEERFQLVMQAANDAIYDWDINSGTVWLSESYRKILDFPANDADNYLWWKSHLHPADRERMINNLRKIIRGDVSIWTGEYRFLCADGRYINVFDRGQIIRDEKGMPVRIVGSMMDITERKLAEEAMAISEAKYRFLTEKMSDLVWTTDMNLTFTYISPSIRRNLGYKQEEFTGRKLADFVTPESEAHARDILEKELIRNARTPVESERSLPLEIAIYHINGSVRWFENVVSFIRDNNEQVIGLYGVSRNITEQKLAVEEREKLIVELKKALSEVKTLSGMLPICANCKKIRDDQGYWNQIENYLSKHSEALFSHSICPECAASLYPDIVSGKKK